MILSFADRATEQLWREGRSRTFPAEIVKVALRKLYALDAALVLDDLRNPPGNRLEALKRDRVGSHSIRVNDKWRLCFVWKEDGAHDVEIVDYH